MKVVLKNKWVLLIGIIILLVISFIVYKTQFTNPVGVNNEFYKDRIFVYETIMEALEEERPLTTKEKVKIEEITEDFYTEDESESRLNTSVSAMYIYYDLLASRDDDDYKKDEYIEDFARSKKRAENILKIK